MKTLFNAKALSAVTICMKSFKERTTPVDKELSIIGIFDVIDDGMNNSLKLQP